MLHHHQYCVLCHTTLVDGSLLHLNFHWGLFLHLVHVGKRWLICLLKIVCLLTWKGIEKTFAKRKLKYLLHRSLVIISEDFIMHEMSFFSLLRFYTCKSKIYYQSNAFRKILVHSSYFLYDIYVNVCQFIRPINNVLFRELVA